jgi:hypothetical protein
MEKKEYMVLVDARNYRGGRFGPFEDRGNAERCVIALAGCPDIYSVLITEREPPSRAGGGIVYTMSEDQSQKVGEQHSESANQPR